VQSCDTFQSKNINAFLHAFYTFVHCVQHWLGCEKFDVKETKSKYTSKTLLQELTDHLRAVKEANDLLNIEDVNMDDSRYFYNMRNCLFHFIKLNSTSNNM
jgi:hypothetical protein